MVVQVVVLAHQDEKAEMEFLGCAGEVFGLILTGVGVNFFSFSKKTTLFRVCFLWACFLARCSAPLRLLHLTHAGAQLSWSVGSMPRSTSTMWSTVVALAPQYAQRGCSARKAARALRYAWVSRSGRGRGLGIEQGWGCCV